MPRFCDLVFDPSWFEGVAETTMQNHRQRFDTFQHNLPQADIATDLPAIVEFCATKWKHPGNGFNTLKKIRRAVLGPEHASSPLLKSPRQRTTAYLHQSRTENDKKLWVDWGVLQGACDRLYRSNPTTEQAVNDLLLLGLYVYNAPRRNDYRLVRVVNDARAHANDTSANFVCKRTKAFVFNVYKTSKAYGRQTVNVAKPLWKIIKVHQDTFRHPNDYLFGKALTTSQYTDMLRQTTQRHTGKRIGSRMLRKMFLTDVHGEEMQRLQSLMEKRANDMGHSVNSSIGYIRPTAASSTSSEGMGKTAAPGE